MIFDTLPTNPFSMITCCYSSWCFESMVSVSVRVTSFLIVSCNIEWSRFAALALSAFTARIGVDEPDTRSKALHH